MRKLLTAVELAEALTIKTGTVQVWSREGKIPSIKLSHKVIRFDLDEVIEALQSQQTPEAQTA